MKLLTNICLLALTAWLIGSPVSVGDDWPQWRGPNRDDVSSETGLLQQWPDNGPSLIWSSTSAGLGYSGFAIVGDRLYTMGQEEGQQFAICLASSDGEEIWRTEVGSGFANNWGDGPRSTPTVDGDDVFVLSADGELCCLATSDGSKRWSTKLTDLGGEAPFWGYSESVLVDNGRVICTPGGSDGAIVAIDRQSGETLWQSADFQDPAQYSSVVAAEMGGQLQYIQLTMGNLVGLDAEDGSVVWQSSWPGRTAVIPTPIVRGDSVYVASGYGVGCKRVDINGDDAEEVWFNKVMKNHHGGVILVGDHLYGYSDDVGWACQSWETGELVWSEKSKLGKGAIGYADGRLYCVDESSGTVVLIAASPDGWQEHGRFTLAPQTSRRKPAGRIWVHPTIANGKLFLRDQEIIYCFDIEK